MHELSIAIALVERVRCHVSPGGRGATVGPGTTGVAVRRVRIRAGVLRAIVPEAMTAAWQAATDGTELGGSRLDVQIEPWTLHCHACGRQWAGEDPLECCRCGSSRVSPRGGDELVLESIEVDDPAGAVEVL